MPLTPADLEHLVAFLSQNADRLIKRIWVASAELRADLRRSYYENPAEFDDSDPVQQMLNLVRSHAGVSTNEFERMSPQIIQILIQVATAEAPLERKEIEELVANGLIAPIRDEARANESHRLQKATRWRQAGILVLAADGAGLADAGPVAAVSMSFSLAYYLIKGGPAQ